MVFLMQCFSCESRRFQWLLTSTPAKILYKFVFNTFQYLQYGNSESNRCMYGIAICV